MRKSKTHDIALQVSKILQQLYEYKSRQSYVMLTNVVHYKSHLCELAMSFKCVFNINKIAIQDKEGITESPLILF